MESHERVAIFVDYENLFYSMYNKFQSQPNPMELIRIARQYGQISIAKAYGDFEKNQYIKSEVPKLRAASFEVVHTRTELVGGKEKSYTDFKIIEDIFVFREESKDVSTIILATGDGHFSNIVARMKIRDGKQVIVVGVKGAISRELQMAAGKEGLVEILGLDYQVDIEDLRSFIISQERRHQYLTFIRTAHAYLDKLKIPDELKNSCMKKTIMAMNFLIEEGYLQQVKTVINDIPVNIIQTTEQPAAEDLG